MTEGKECNCHPNSDRAYIAALEKEMKMLLYRPAHFGQARKSLDAGLLSATFDRLVSEDEPQKYMIIVLGALAMQVGAEMDARHLHIMRSIYQTVGLRDDGMETMKWGLDRYGNHGKPVPWHAGGELFSPDEPDANIQARFREQENAPERKRGPAHAILMPKNDPKVNAKKHGLDGKPACWYCGGTPKLIQRCVRCKRAYYCNRRCQTNDWTNYHAYVCYYRPDRIVEHVEIEDDSDVMSVLNIETVHDNQEQQQQDEAEPAALLPCTAGVSTATANEAPLQQKAIPACPSDKRRDSKKRKFRVEKR